MNTSSYKGWQYLLHWELLHWEAYLFVCLCIFLVFFFSFFYGCTIGIWKFPGQGVNLSCSCWPTPQPQKCGIPAMSVTYTTAHSNAGFLTHWARPGIKPTSSWILVGFITTEPQWELPFYSISIWKLGGLLHTQGEEELSFTSWQEESIYILFGFFCKEVYSSLLFIHSFTYLY